MVGDLGRCIHNRTARLVLAVEGAKRVQIGTMIALFAELFGVLVNEPAHQVAVLRATLLAAHGVQQQTRFRGGNADGLIEAHEHDDGLGIHCRLVGAQALHAHLAELAKATLLRALGAEHRACVHELGRSAALGNQVVLHNRANGAGRAFGAKGKTALRLQRFAGEQLLQVAAGNNGEHLLGNHVGGLAYAAHEQVGLLEQRGLDGLIAATTEDLERGLAEMVPKPHVIGKQVERSLGCLRCHMLCFALFREFANGLTCLVYPRHPPNGTCFAIQRATTQANRQEKRRSPRKGLARS